VRSARRQLRRCRGVCSRQRRRWLLRRQQRRLWRRLQASPHALNATCRLQPSAAAVAVAAAAAVVVAAPAGRAARGHSRLPHSLLAWRVADASGMRNCVRCPTGDGEEGQAPPPAGGLPTRDTGDGSASESKARLPAGGLPPCRTGGGSVRESKSPPPAGGLPPCRTVGGRARESKAPPPAGGAAAPPNGRRQRAPQRAEAANLRPRRRQGDAVEI